ncbi:unnamed protein product [Hapterophycus canaliculatus]
MSEPQPPTTKYENVEAIADEGAHESIAPEELLALPTSVRRKHLADPRRRDLFSALRRRQGQAKRRRRRESEGRRSEEILASMLTRTVQDARACNAGQQLSSPSNCLALLRVGCPRPAFQRLHRPAEVGLGCAMGMCAGDDSDLGSGISEWGSGDDGDMAAFESLLHEEAKAVRRCHKDAASLASPCTSRSRDSSPQHSPCVVDRFWSISAVERTRSREEYTSSAPDPQLCSPAGFSTPTPATESIQTLKNTPPSGLEKTLPPQRASPKPLQPPTETDNCQQQASTVSRYTRITPPTKRSEGVQCSHPIDQGVQTSSLRLPRKSIAAGDRVFQARPSTSKDGTPSPGSHGVDQNHVEPSRRIANGHKATDNRRWCSTSTPEVPSGPARIGESRSDRRAGRMHVRVGLEGLQDADQEQQPTIWAVARGENATGPIMMLPLEGDYLSGSDGSVRGMRRFLRVTDIAGGLYETGSQNGTKLTPEGASFVHAQGNGGAGSSSRNQQEDVDNPSPESNAVGRHRRTSDLGSLWQGLDSLGERLAGVGYRFDQLDREICHDQQEIERCQKEAQEEVEMAKKYLEGVQAHRALHPTAKAPALPQVSSWRSRPDASVTLALETKVSIIKTASPVINETPRSAFGRGSCGTGSSGEGFSSGGAALQAEQELREARQAISASFQREPKKDAVTSAVPASPRQDTGANQLQHPKHHLTVHPRLRQEQQLPGRSDSRADSSSGGRSLSKGSRRAGRVGFFKGGGSARSIGTAIAHFPTAVAASKANPRGRHATKRAWS